MALKNGVFAYGEGNWEEIRSLYSVLNVKIGLQLRDK